MPEYPEFETTSLSRERAGQASDDALTLQVCKVCDITHYPSRDVCRNCLSGELSWSAVPTAGQVLAVAVVHASLHPSFRERGPWRICSVALDAGPRVLAHAADDAIQSGDAVDVRDRQIGEMQYVLIARPRAEAPHNREQE